MNKKAFTLVEVLIVIAMIGILAAMLMPVISAVKNGEVHNTGDYSQPSQSVYVQNIGYVRVFQIEGQKFMKHNNRITAFPTTKITAEKE